MTTDSGLNDWYDADARLYVQWQHTVDDRDTNRNIVASVARDFLAGAATRDRLAHAVERMDAAEAVFTEASATWEAHRATKPVQR